MSTDTLLNWASNPTTRKMISAVGLPTPQPLTRADGPWSEEPLEGLTVSVGEPSSSAVSKLVEEMGATVVNAAGEDKKLHGLVFDGRSISSVEDMRGLYDFFHSRIRTVGRCGRVVVLGLDPARCDTAEASAVQQGLVGFTKSVAKEVGRKGSTANLITMDAGADDGLPGPLRFLLGRRSAFVSGQTLHVDGVGEAGVWSQPLAGKTALVTGCARGIGEATARRLAAEGAKLICLDIPPDAEALELLAEELGGVALPLDITDPAAADKIAEAASGSLDVLVHNAGITRDKTLGKMDEKLWDMTLEVNLGSVIRVTEALVAGGTIPQGGRIVLVSSIAGLAGNTGQTNYAASKAGVAGLARSLGASLKDKGIATNAVAPGFIETRMTQAIPFGIREVGRRLSNLNQGGLPTDVADAITFLSSPGAGGLHGNVLRVCGGNLLGA
jgi:3-oxoacyl-[acyl-carrier protein] reductase